MKYSLFGSIIGLILFIVGYTIVKADEPIKLVLLWLGIIGALLAIFLVLKYVYNPIHEKLTRSKRWNSLLAWDFGFVIAFYALMFWIAASSEEDEKVIRIIIYTIILFIILVSTFIDNIKKRRGRSK